MESGEESAMVSDQASKIEEEGEPYGGGTAIMESGEESAMVSDQASKTEGDEGKSRDGGTAIAGAVSGGNAEIDVSQEALEVFMFRSPPRNRSQRGLYVYRNTFHLVPRAIEQFRSLKKLKFFTNEVEVLPPEVGDLVDLEILQVKIPLPGLSGLPFQKLKCLREVAISREPVKLSSFTFLSGISALENLTKLSICHFSIRYLPTEIGCLKKLEELDLSFNKLKNLPSDITELSALKTLRVANNKLANLPSGLSSLKRLENLDLSNNRLTSLTSLDLASMQALQNLNLQYNKILHCSKVPSWICCNFEGNGKDIYKDGINRSIVEVGIHDTAIHRVQCNLLCNDGRAMSCLYHAVPLSSRQRTRKGWKCPDYLKHMARQERLNFSRKCRGKNINGNITMEVAEEDDSCVTSVAEDVVEHDVESKLPDSSAKSKFSSENISSADDSDACSRPRESTSSATPNCMGDKIIGSSETTHGSESVVSDSSVCCTSECNSLKKDLNFDNGSREINSSASPNQLSVLDKRSSCGTSDFIHKSKRHSDKDLLNPKPSKSHRHVNECSSLSCKYSSESFCSIDDHIPDGFYDAGRNRPFMSLEDYEQCVHHFDQREIILLDREKDEELDAIASSAQILLSSWRSSCSTKKEERDDNMHRASMLALFVSDCFGGTDRSDFVSRMRRAIYRSNKQQPFVCTCSDRSNHDPYGVPTGLSIVDICDKSIQLIKETRNSSVVPIGTLRVGVCRHRAVLMKYLCDRANPPIPCELVRGYLDFTAHAWNAILVRRGNTLVRMIVDACHPTDIREETDPEYFCRYIPLSRGHVPFTTENFSIPGCILPSSLMNHGTDKTACSVTRCKFGTLDAAVKIRNFEANHHTSGEEVTQFERIFLAEVRMLGALKKHKCIVELYGHQLSSTWIPPENGNKENRLLQSMIIMEYIKGGSLKCYLDKLLERGEKHVPIDMALCIARDVACALVEVHAKDIIHRDIKSDNILMDLDSKRDDGTPVVKLSDFDWSVPLQSSKHTCCIAHHGVQARDFCIGTPRWMAPEVVQAMHQRNPYGLEVDIWSYGCVLFELLTLQTPYQGQSDSELYELLQKKQRPRLTPELEALIPSDENETRSEPGPPSDAAEADGVLTLLVELFCQCTRGNPADRPTARQIYNRLCAVSAQPPDASSA